MRIHCLENVEKALQFLREQRVHLENLGAHDVVDGNPRLTLGLIWTIILRFQVGLPCDSKWVCRAIPGGFAARFQVGLPCDSRWVCRAIPGGFAVVVWKVS